ncbi:MAG TPA: hypothetical protein VF527_20370 [Pyrinomonadaceae bacterium]
MVSTQTGSGGDENRRLNLDAAAEGSTETPGGGDASLEEAAEREREYLCARLRDELRRDPTEEELNEWLREHTEGY